LSTDSVQDHYLVTFHDAAWQFTFRGTVTGPIKSREEAVTLAIAEAERNGEGDIEVIVQDPDLRQETVWRSGDK